MKHNNTAKESFAGLLLTRNAGEKIDIGDDIEITVVKVQSGQVKLGIKAPKDISILRREITMRLRDDDRGNQ